MRMLHIDAAFASSVITYLFTLGLDISWSDNLQELRGIKANYEDF